jgi:hypothetical protein
MPSTTFSSVFAIAVVFAAHAVALGQNTPGTISGQIRAANGTSAVAIRVGAMPLERNAANDGSNALMSIAETDFSGRYRRANGRVPNFSLTVRLNGTEGYQISASPQLSAPQVSYALVMRARLPGEEHFLTNLLSSGMRRTRGRSA